MTSNPIKHLPLQLSALTLYTPVSVKNNRNPPRQKLKFYENPGKKWLFKSAILRKPRQKLLIFYSPRWQNLAGFLDPVTKNSTPVGTFHFKVTPVSFQDPTGSLRQGVSLRSKRICVLFTGRKAIWKFCSFLFWIYCWRIWSFYYATFIYAFKVLERCSFLCWKIVYIYFESESRYFLFTFLSFYCASSTFERFSFEKSKIERFFLLFFFFWSLAACEDLLTFKKFWT